MKYSKLFLSIISVITLLSACTKSHHHDDESEFTRFVFGHFYGFCGGETCVEIFKLEGGALYEDTLDIYPKRDDFYTGSFVKLSDEAYQKTKDLPDYFPDKLWSETKKVLGQPDAGDWGGLYIEVLHGPHKEFWILDQHKANMDSVYHLFIDKVNEKIRALQ